MGNTWGVGAALSSQKLRCVSRSIRSTGCLAPPATVNFRAPVRCDVARDLRSPRCHTTAAHLVSCMAPASASLMGAGPARNRRAP